jgi:uncharacterized protein (DUF1499 family)
MFINSAAVIFTGLIFLSCGLPGGPVSAAEALPSLRPCPSSPNCVSSQAEDPGHRVEPFPPAGKAAETLSRLEKAIKTFPRTAVVLRDEHYLKVEFRTRLGFVDDVEFLVEEDRGLVQVRSASRTGYWDLGVNRRRVEDIRKVYLELKGNP